MAVQATIIGENIQLTGNPIEIKCTGANAPAGSTNHRILLKIHSVDGKLYGAPFEAAESPVNNEATFDISGYVDQPVNLKFQYPVSGAVVSYPTRSFKVQVQPGECWLDEDGIYHERYDSVSNTLRLLKGGSSPRQLSLWSDESTNFEKVYIDGKRWLTHRPWGDFVHPKQPVKLWFIVNQNKTVTYSVTAYYFDGSSQQFTESVSLDTESVYEFNCNPADLGIQLEKENTKINHFDVVLLNDNSLNHRFHYDWRYCKRPFFILFANSAGGIDDVYLSGYGKENFELQTTMAYIPHMPDDTVFDRTLLPANKHGQNKWMLNSGPKMYSQMLHLRDLMVARHSWLLYPTLDPDNRMIVPVSIRNFNDTLVDHSKKLHNITMEVSEGHTSQYSFDNRIY